ncbi:hypothetical protein J2T20_003290 [Paenibacillus wynnii]|nr:hypothetical protein [Paenibacillus wynnii]
MKQNNSEDQTYKPTAVESYTIKANINKNKVIDYLLKKVIFKAN